MTRALPGGWVLGPELGRGGTATVWAVERFGERAAAKVLSASVAQRRDLVDALRTEIRVVAALDHAAIVQLLDAGDVPEGLGLPVGAPFVVMERALGTLAEVPPSGGAALREALTALLSGLAHAHARGVLHRDVKPANLLRVTRPEGPSWALADFGLSLDTRIDARGILGGTPGFAPPEQLAGDPLEGPWTDLYAVGVTAWSALAGCLPGPTGPTVPTSWPEPVREWLRWLLDPDPGRRPDHAVAALHGLEALTDHDLSPRAGGAGRRDTFVFTGETQVVALHPAPRWTGAVAPSGLGALRRVSPTGLRIEQEACWAAVEAAAGGRSRLLWITAGQDGVGASTLAEWVCEQVAELGLGEVFHLRGAPLQSPTRGDLVATALRAPGAGPEVLARAARRFGVPDPDAVLDLVWPSRTGGRPRSYTELDSVLYDVLRRRAGSRVPVLHLDDAQWSPELLSFATAAHPGPLLTVLTARPDPETDSVAQLFLEEAAADPRVVRVEITRSPVAPTAAWLERSASLPAPSREAVEALAVLGGSALLQTWMGVVAAAGGSVTAELPALLDQGLVRRTGHTWSLVHGSLGAQLTAGLSDGRRTLLHRACADVLSDGTPSEALGVHLLRAGRRLAAAVVLVDLAAPDVRTRERRLDRAEQLLAIDPPDAAAVAPWLVRLQLRALGPLSEADELVDRVLRWGRTSHDPLAPWALLWVPAFLAASRRDRAASEATLRDLEAAGDPPPEWFGLVEATIWHKLRSDLLRNVGRLPEAIAAATQAVDGAQKLTYRLFALLSRASLELLASRFEACRGTLASIEQHGASAGATLHANWLQLRSGLALAEGNLDHALELVERSIEDRRRLGVSSPHGQYARAGLLLLSGRLEEGGAVVDELPENLDGRRRLLVSRVVLSGGALPPGGVDELELGVPDNWHFERLLPERVARALDERGDHAGAARVRSALG